MLSIGHYQRRYRRDAQALLKKWKQWKFVYAASPEESAHAIESALDTIMRHGEVGDYFDTS